MKNTKNSKGITLVALIITIVVLLILAVVAIGAVEESNIIGHAQNAATSYNQKRTEEEEVLTDAEGLLGNLVNSINNGNKTPVPPPNPPATTVVSYYKADGVIQVFEVTGNAVIGNVYSLNGDTISLLFGPISGVVNNVVSPVTINLSGGLSEDITTEDMQIEVSGNVSTYIKGNYLYGANSGEDSYSVFQLITDTAEIADIEGKIANLNSSADVENIVVQ